MPQEKKLSSAKKLIDRIQMIDSHDAIRQTGRESDLFNEGKVVDIIKDMIRRTSVPDNDSKINCELYRSLVERFTKAFKEENIDPLDAEVTARKLAAWVMKYEERLKNSRRTQDFFRKSSMGNSVELKNSKNRKPILEEESLTEDEYEEGNVKVYNLTDEILPYWNIPGEVVELYEEDGSKVYVKSFEDSNKGKTLVRKLHKNKNGNIEESMWVVELPQSCREESFVSLDDSLSCSSVTSVESKNMRSPSTVDEWKTMAEIMKEEALSWKQRLGVADLIAEQSSCSIVSNKAKERKISLTRLGNLIQDEHTKYYARSLSSKPELSRAFLNNKLVTRTPNQVRPTSIKSTTISKKVRNSPNVSKTGANNYNEQGDVMANVDLYQESKRLKNELGVSSRRLLERCRTRH